MGSDWSERARELTARRIERRQFLRGALGVSGLAVLNGMGLARAAFPRSSADLPPIPGESGLDTIVVTMMENRSLDHYLGWVPGIDGAQAGFSNPSSLDYNHAADEPCPPVGGFAAAPGATAVETFRLEDHCNIPDPDHGWNGGRVELNRGALNGFADRSPAVGMGYYLEEDVPFLGWLATGFTTFSRYHCSVLGPTFPNRLYLMSAQGGGFRDNHIPAPNQQNPVPTGHTWPSIFDVLSAAGVPWAAYASDVPQVALFFHLLSEHPGRVRHITDYYADAAAGRLPNVVFLDPAFFTYGNDDHPAHDIRLGQRFIQDSFLALAEGPQWANAAYVLTYDEWGGFFDHVLPPRAPDGLADADHCGDWGQLGFRVPTVIASPFARRGFVGEGLYDHTSILKLIEWRFGLAPLTARDAWAANLGEVLDFEHPMIDFPGEPPFIPLHGAGVACAQNPVVEELGGNPLEPVPDIPLPPPVVPDPDEPHAELRAIADSGVLGRADFRERALHGVFRD